MALAPLALIRALMVGGEPAAADDERQRSRFGTLFFVSYLALLYLAGTFRVGGAWPSCNFHSRPSCCS